MIYLVCIFAGFLCMWATHMIVLANLDENYAPYRRYLLVVAGVMFSIAFIGVMSL